MDTRGKRPASSVPGMDPGAPGSASRTAAPRARKPWSRRWWPTRAVIIGAFVLPLVTWFVLMPASWWMGVLHLPLVILSIVALAVGRRTDPQTVA